MFAMELKVDSREKDLLIEKIRSYDPRLDENAIRKALDFGEKAHSRQLRASGEPYFLHPIQVATVLTELKLDNASIITALLHDTVEDTEATLEDIEKNFGDEVARLVDGVTKLTRLELKSDSESVKQAENFRKLLLAMSEDIRVLLVKLADRLHNMQTIQHVSSPEKRRRIAAETMEIYAPLAERIGIQTFKDRLQDLSFAVLYPEARQSILNRLNYLREKGNIVVARTIDSIKRTLADNGLEAEITGREKTPYSIWSKMQRKNVSFEQLADIVAFRVFVNTVQECYQALGIIHSSYHMIPERFRDFISTPKANGYKSLHTTVMGPENQPIEIQIRTYEMHEIADLGVAAHWTYKQGQSGKDGTDGKQYRWIRELLSIMAQTASPEEFLENTKLEMYHDQVFCFTPKGNLIALPRGSTPVDFAFAVHSDVGYTCVGAKVNGRIVPLRAQLQNGDQVEIIRSKSQTPSPTWERFVVTGKARSEIRRFIRTQQRSEYITLGRAILTKAFEAEGLDFSDKMLEPALRLLNKKHVDDVLCEVGEGLIAKSQVFEAVFPDKKSLELLKPRKEPKKPAAKKVDNSIPIRGLIPGMALHFAGCCHPLPGDKIVGIVTTGRGITIHVSDCETLENFSETPERWIDVSWDTQSDDQVYLGRVKIILPHETGSLATVANSIAKDEGNITNLKIANRSTDFFEMIIDIEVRDLKQLNIIIANLRTIPLIHSVERAGQ